MAERSAVEMDIHSVEHLVELRARLTVHTRAVHWAKSLAVTRTDRTGAETASKRVDSWVVRLVAERVDSWAQ